MPQTKFDELRVKAESNDTQAMLELALAYRNGEGVEPDLDEFFVWIRKAAEKRDPLMGYVTPAVINLILHCSSDEVCVEQTSADGRMVRCYKLIEQTNRWLNSGGRNHEEFLQRIQAGHSLAP